MMEHEGLVFFDWNERVKNANMIKLNKNHKIFK